MEWLYKSPPCRQEDETHDECVDRKIPELIDEGYDQDEAVAIANDMCDKKCSEENMSILRLTFALRYENKEG